MKPWTNFANYQRGPRISSREEVGTGGGRLSMPLFLICLPILIQLLSSYSIEWYDDL